MKAKQGFTLIELIVAITIVAILAAVGLVIFKGVSERTRDSRKKADIESIAKAYETNYGFDEQRYRELTKDDFTSGKKPVPPEGGEYQGGVINEGKAFKICAQLEGFTGDCLVMDTEAEGYDQQCYCRGSSLRR